MRGSGAAFPTEVEAGMDVTVILRLLRVFGESLARIAEAEGAVYRRHFVDPLRQAGEDTSRSMQLASAMAGRLIPVLEDMTLAVYHRQQEHTWLQNLIESIEMVLESEGLHQPLQRPPAMCFLDLTGYTRLTEDRGDEAAAQLAARLGAVVQSSAVKHGGRPVKWLGDGVMSYFPDPAGAVRAGLVMVERAEVAGLPPAHVGLAAGPIVYQDGDYFGRTVNLAARLSAHAPPGMVVVSAETVAAVRSEHTFKPLGRVELRNITEPVEAYQVISEPQSEIDADGS
jgi:adenylate cyclase